MAASGAWGGSLGCVGRQLWVCGGWQPRVRGVAASGAWGGSLGCVGRHATWGCSLCHMGRQPAADVVVVKLEVPAVPFAVVQVSDVGKRTTCRLHSAVEGSCVECVLMSMFRSRLREGSKSRAAPHAGPQRWVLEPSYRASLGIRRVWSRDERSGSSFERRSKLRTAFVAHGLGHGTRARRRQQVQGQVCGHEAERRREKLSL